MNQAPPPTTAVPIAIDSLDLKRWYEAVDAQKLNEIAAISSVHESSSDPEQIYSSLASASILLLLHAGRVQVYGKRLFAALSQLPQAGRPAVVLISITDNVLPSDELQFLGRNLLQLNLGDMRSGLKDVVAGLATGAFIPVHTFAPRLRTAIISWQENANLQSGTGGLGSAKMAPQENMNAPGVGGLGVPDSDEEETAANISFDQFPRDEFSELALQILHVARRLGEGRPRPQVSVRRLLTAIVLSGIRRKGDERTGSWLASLITQPREELRDRIAKHYPAVARHKGSFDTILHSDLPVSANMTQAMLDVIETAKHLATEARPGVPMVVGTRHLLGAAIRQDESETTARKTLREFGLDLDEVRHKLIEQLPVWGLDDDQDAWHRILETAVADVERRLPTYAADSAVGPDLIGITREVEAMASLVSAWSVEPPLSIGLFGEWGSGKSFFMQKMKERVKQIAIEARKSNQAQRDFGYYKNIVQVEFNAWHYVEGNLWASLVEHIFTNLRFEGTPEENLDSEVHINARLDKMLGLLREKAADADAKDKQSKDLHATADAAEQKAKTADSDAANAKATANQAELASRAAMQSAIEKHANAQNISELRRTMLAKDIVEEVTLSPKVRDEVEKGLEQLGVTKERLETVQGFRNALREATETGNVIVEGLNLVRKDSGWLLLLWAVAVPVAVIAIGAAFNWLTGNSKAGWLQQVEITLKVLSALMTVFITSWAKLKPRLQPLLELVQKMKAKRAELEADVEKARQNRAVEAAKLDQQVIQLQAEAETQRQTAAKKDAEALSARQAAENHRTDAEKAAKVASDARAAAEALARESEALQPERRIATFIQDRASASDYRRHLGVPALIRRDFEKLSAMFETQRKKEENGEDCGPGNQQNDATVVNRIILYIDDLDRCPPGKVVDVLRAIHLLLAFRLFVVVVAVDARWMKRSLKDRFSLMLSSPDTRPATGKGRTEVMQDENIAWRATASPDDYLEKIFQVPFWIRPLGRSGSRRLVTELTKHDVEAAPVATNNNAPLENARTQKSSSETNAVIASGGSAGGLPPPAQQNPDSPASDKVISEFGPVEPRPHTLMLTPEERSYMVSLASVIGRSPRSVKRFVNCYRLLKSTLDATELERARRSGTFRTPMLMLGIVTGFPEAAPALLSDLRYAPRKQAPAVWAREAAKKLKLEERGKWADLLPVIEQLQQWDVKSVAPLADAAVLVDRFSFSPVQRPVEELV